MPFTFTPGEGGGWVVGTAEPTVPPFGVFTYTIQPVGGWVLEDMTQPATFFAGFASIGPQGPQGQPGEDGGQGPQGPQGEPGAAATVTVGTTITVPAGSPASVINVGSEHAAVLNFGIPQGAQGIQGIQGVKGDKGDTGDSGVAYATSPLSYNSTTKTISIDLSAYASQSWVVGQGYITSAALTGYATQSWVSSQGYITSAALAPYALTSSLGTAAYQSTAYWIQSPSVAATDGQIPAWDAATSRAVWIDNAARTLFITAKNQSGATIPARSVVYISGATGANPLISLAKADAEATSATTIGITSAAIANGATGQVVTAGLLSKVDTSAWPEGTGLYLSATTAGGFTTTLPVAPNHGVYLGVVTRQHTSQGAIEVTIKNYQELEEMSDVLILTPADKNLLAYESSTGLWKNKSFATLDLLTATTAASTYFAIPTGTTAQYLRGNGTLSTFSTDVIAAVPSASTSTAGKVQLATTAEAVAGTDASKAVTAAGVYNSLMSVALNQRHGTSFGFASSGTGAGAQSTDWGQRCFTGTTSGAYAVARSGSNATYPISRGKAAGVVNLSKVVAISASLDSSQYVANSTLRLTFGKNGTDNAGDLARKGFGIRIVGTGAAELQVHDGTTLRNVTSSFTPTANTAYDVLLTSDGAGNVTLYINDSVVATSANGPVGDTANTADYVQLEAATSAILSAQTIAQMSNLKTYFGR